MNERKPNERKKEQKKSFLLREISTLVHALGREEPDVAAVFITRVELSADNGICYIYFAAYPDPKVEDFKAAAQAMFNKALDRLKLYKPSMRTALAKVMHGKYTPSLIFLFDEKQEKVLKINELLDKVQTSLDDYDEQHPEEQEQA
ncbi:ribosome-binding factor A [Candidatus Babeliales bacterium]|nr:ribosome-binding factor A [Candidatus Babeliales bacterium]MBY0352820.1 ribosome-binding factor A [Candidatus Babeliales bacterium]